MTLLNLEHGLVMDIRLLSGRPNHFDSTYDIGAMYLGGTGSGEEFYTLREGLETVETMYKKLFSWLNRPDRVYSILVGEDPSFEHALLSSFAETYQITHPLCSLPRTTIQELAALHEKTKPIPRQNGEPLTLDDIFRYVGVVTDEENKWLTCGALTRSSLEAETAVRLNSGRPRRKGYRVNERVFLRYLAKEPI